MGLAERRDLGLFELELPREEAANHVFDLSVFHLISPLVMKPCQRPPALPSREGVTLIVVTHALDLAHKLGRVLELQDGSLVQK